MTRYLRMIVIPVILAALFWTRCEIANGQVLLSHATGTQNGSEFSYAIFNDEPVGSPNFLTDFFLEVNAPITVTATPTGWTFDTDGFSFVNWFNTDPALPYPNDVAPGASLSDFAISSSVTGVQDAAYDVLSWDHTQDQQGPTAQGGVISPFGQATAVPEPSSISFLGAITVSVGGLILGAWRRTRRSQS
jgi:hypothetical protein